MENSQQLYSEMCELWTTFVVEHEKAAAGNKAAGSRARKAIGEIKKKVTDYRKNSVNESKA